MRTMSSTQRDIEVEFFVETLCSESGVKLSAHQKAHMTATVTDFFEMMDTMGIFSWDDLPKALEEFTREAWRGTVSNFISRKEMKDAVN